MALDIDALIARLQKDTSANITINVINVNQDVDDVDDDDDDGFDTDFDIGYRVMICHVKKDGTGTKHTDGTVTEIDSDDFGPYVRVTGDNGKHYRCGLHLDEERKGSKIIRVLD